MYRYVSERGWTHVYNLANWSLKIVTFLLQGLILIEYSVVIFSFSRLLEECFQFDSTKHHRKNEAIRAFPYKSIYNLAPDL
jgi:hypothetical protein